MPIIFTKVINGSEIIHGISIRGIIIHGISIHSIIINYAVINKTGYGKSL